MEFSFAINIPQIKYSNIRESIEKSGDFGYTHFKIRKLIGAGRKIRVHRERECSPLFFFECEIPAGSVDRIDFRAFGDTLN